LKTPLSDFWDWMTEREGWKAFSGGVYLTICVFDFIIVPVWYGVTRTPIPLEQLKGLEPSVQMRIIESYTVQHEPFTLKGAGMFHLAFGALLTGSAIAGRKNLTPEKDK